MKFDDICASLSKNDIVVLTTDTRAHTKQIYQANPTYSIKYVMQNNNNISKK